MEFKLLDLLRDTEYQKEYTQEERYELFNKYQINTIEPFFMPIHYLTYYLLTQMGWDEKCRRYGYGHGQSILFSDFQEKAKQTKPSEMMDENSRYSGNRPVSYLETQVHEFVAFTPRDERGTIRFRYWLKTDTTLNFQDRLSIRVDTTKGRSFRLPKCNIYELIEHWLKDFKFIK